jgi:hypothetical protein
MFKLSLGTFNSQRNRAMDQAVRRSPFTVEGRVSNSGQFICGMWRTKCHCER